MLTLRNNVSARMSAPVFAVLLVYFFASWFMLAPPGAAGEAHAGQLEFDGVPVDITTAANEDLVIAPGSGGNTQVGTATGTNSHATTNDDLHITGTLEVDGISYFDSAVYLGDTTSDTVTVTGYFGSSLIPSVDSTYDLGSSGLAWRYLYADIISGINANLALNPATGYSLTGAVTKNASSGNEVAYDYAATINKAAGNYTGIRLNLTQTAAGGPATANFLFDLQRDGVSMFNVDSAGNVTAVGTITGSAAALNGTKSHIFTVNSDNDNALTTLRFGGSGGSDGTITTVSGDLIIDSNSGTVDINDGILDLSTQTVDVTLNNAVDALNIDSDTVSVDASNDRVGINNAAPENSLHVNDELGNVEVAKFEAVDSAAIRIDAQAGNNTSATRYYVGGALLGESGYTPVAPGNGYYISVGGTRFLTLDGSGFLGLGDTTPVANLVVGSDAGAAVAGAGDAYIQNDLEVDGTLYAASAAIAGTSSDTFTIDTDNTSATPTLTFGNGGNPFITTPAGNLNLQPASAVIVRDATAPAPAKATAAGSMFVENAFENTGIAYHYDDITIYDKKSFAVISSADGNPDYAHSIYISQSDNIMQFKEWDTFKFTNTSAEPDIDLITLTPTAGMTLLNDDAVDNAVSDILKIQHSSTNAPQAGIGTGLAYYVEDAGNLQKHGSIDTVLTTVAQGSENADMVFKISEAGALTELMRLNAASDRVDISGDLNVTGTISGALSAAGTTSDTWEVNTDGNSVTIDSSGQTSDHDYTFPNASGKVLTTDMSDATVAVTLNNAINALNFAGDTLTIDAANKRVGVNTGNPGAQLEVVGTLKVVTGSESTFYAAAVGPYMYIQPKDVAGTDYTRIGGWSSAAAATNLVFQPAGGNIGIGGTFDGNPVTLAPSYLISLDGQSGRTVGMERHQSAGQAGNDLSVQAGGAYATGSNLNGGNLLLKAGTATGTGASAIIFQTAKAAAAGAADNDPATRALIGGTSLALSPHGTAAGNTLELRFSELAAGGANYVGFKAPDAIGDDLIWTLPSGDGSDGHVLKTNGLGTLSFGAVGGSTAITGTTNDTFEVNSDGNSVTVSSAGQTSDHVFTFPDATGTVLTTNMPADVAVTLGGGVDALNFDSNTLSIDADANRVGIGTASPQYALDVVDTARINNSAGAASLILTGSGDVFAYSYINLLNEAGDKSWNVQHRKAAGFVNDFVIEEYDGANYYQRFIVRPGGAVGIGTTDFDGTPALGHLLVKGTTNDGSTNIQVWRDSDEANVAYLDTNGNLTLSGAISAGSSSLSGTTSDTFEVNTDGFGAVISTTNRSTDGTYTLPNVAGAAQILTTNMSDAAAAVTIYAAGVNGLSFDTDTLSIDAQNKWVGIGTTSPDARLTVDGGASYSGYVSTRSTNDNYCGILFTDEDGLQWGLYKNATADPILQFGRYTDGVWQAAPISFARNGDVVFGDRYVGIGDTDPVASLVVGSDGGASVSGAGDAYIQNDLEVDGTLYAAGSSLTGTTANTFTLNSDNTADIATTLTFGGAGTGTGSVTTTVGDLTIAPNGGTTSVTGDIDVSGRIELDSANAINNNGTASISVGALAGANNAGSGNTFMGASAGTAVNSGSDNTFIGNNAGAAATTAIKSTFVGSNAGSASNADNNVFIGYYAGQSVSGTDNVCVGQAAGYSSSSAESNTFIGSAAGGSNTIGDQNVYIGGNAGYANSTGNGNVFIGYKAGEDLDPVSNTLIIDNTDTATPLIYGDFSTDTVTINGTLNATTVGFSGTAADTFTINSDGTAAASTLALGAAGTTGGSITTGAGNLTIDSTGGTIDINDGVLDLSTQTVDVTLNDAADALNFDSNTLSIDASQNFVGIGTAAPDRFLTIAPPDNAEASIGMVSTSGAGAEIYLGSGGAYSGAIGYTQNFAGAIEFKTNGTTNADSKVIISSAGKVGIGTGTVTEPAAALDVQAAVTAASAVANGVRFQQTLTAAADNDSLSGLLINTTYADGGFSGVKHNGIAFPDAQGTKINVGYDAGKAKWIGIDGSWRQGFANDTGFEFYISSNNTSWGDSKFHIDTDSADFYVDPVVGTSGTNRWLKMYGNILFEENDDYIGTYNTGTFTIGNLQNTSTATTVNFGRDGGIDVMNLNRGGTTYNFLTLKSAGTDDITLDPAGGDVSVDGNITTTSDGNITAGGSGAVQCGTGAFKSSDGTAGLTGTYNIDGSAAGTVATMEFKNGILVAVTTR